MMYGFETGSARRSREFLKEFMGLGAETSDLLYAVVRCGLAHECVPKLGIRFFVMYYDVQDEVLYESNDGLVWLSVVKLAKEYLRVVESISTSKRGQASAHTAVQHGRPEPITAVLNQGLPQIDDLCERIAAKLREPEERRFSRGEIESMSSYNPFMSDSLPASEIDNEDVC